MVVSGNEQTDTVANPLKDPLVLRATVDGISTPGLTIKFVASGCAATDTLTTQSTSDGTAIYSWTLAGNIGQQTLNAYLVNDKGETVDSVKALATALAPKPGWHNSACSVFASSSPNIFCRLSSGRLFVNFGFESFLRYSDDNGASWFAVKSLGNNKNINYIAASPNDELFAFTIAGTFYSTDAGKTWINQGVPPFDTRLIHKVSFSNTGQLLVTGVDPLLSISSDKGKTWKPIRSNPNVGRSIEPGNYYDCNIDADNNIYLTARGNDKLYKSSDGGQTWDLILQDTFSFFIDAMGQFYRSSDIIDNGLFISNNQGFTYDRIFSYPRYDGVFNMSDQPDGYLYFDQIGVGISRLAKGSSKPELIFPDNVSEEQPYIVAKNGNIIIANTGHSYVRYLSK